jgi:type IV pilus assembly protein PilB
MARAKLGEILMQRGVINAAALKRALGEQIRFAGQKIRLGQLLVDMRACTWEQVCQALSEQLGFPYANLEAAEEATVKLVPVDVCEKWRAVAFHRELGPPEQVCVAFEDPSDLVAIDAIRLRVGKRVKVFLGAPDAVKTVLDRVFRGIDGAAGTGGLALENELFGGSDDAPMTVEHYEAGSLSVEGSMAMDGSFAQAEAPPPARSSATSDDLDSLLGGPAQAAEPQPRARATAELEPSASAAAGLGDPFAGLGLEASPPRNVPPPPPANTAKVPVTHFPDKRVKEPAPTAAKPTLVLTSDALFGKVPGAADPVDPDELSVEMISSEPEPAAPSLPEPTPLFGTPFDASALADPEDDVSPVVEAMVELSGEAAEVEEVDLDEISLESKAAGPVAEPPPASAPPALAPEPAQAEARPPSKPAEELKPAKVEARPPSKAAEPALPADDDSLASFADRPLTAEELDIVGAIEQLADGAIEASPVKQTKPAHMIAALIRLLIRQGIIQETEFLAELSRK